MLPDESCVSLLSALHSRYEEKTYLVAIANPPMTSPYHSVHAFSLSRLAPSPADEQAARGLVGVILQRCTTWSMHAVWLILKFPLSHSRWNTHLM